jgi:hypothetical protein
MALPLSRRPLDYLFLAYFLLHLPISIGVDLQLIFPREHFPLFLRTTLDGWVKDADDVLTGTAPLFYRVFVWIELFFHIPFFVAAIYAFVRGKEWIRLPTIIYATEVLTSMAVVIAESWDRSHAPLQTKLKLQSVLAIWCILPLMLLVRCWPERMFAQKDAATAVASKKKQ